MEDMDEIQALMIDSGCSKIKAGFSGDDAPRAVFPSVVGRPKRLAFSQQPNYSAFFHNDAYVGDEAISKWGILTLNYPVENGIATNWDDMEKIWHHTFYNELCVAPEEHPIILSEPPLNPKANRERITQIMFETFDVPAMYLETNCVLSLVHSGRNSGLVLKSGDSMTYVVPIYDGFLVPHGIISAQFGGRDLNNYLEKLLGEVVFSITTSLEKILLSDMKEKLCYVSQDYQNDLEKAVLNSSGFEKTYKLPDGTIISIGKERFRCPEAYFQPELVGKSFPGVHQMIYESILENDVQLRPILLRNIVLAGGSTLFEGFANRLKNELMNYFDSSEIEIIAPPEAKYSAWIGGSILSSSSDFQNRWITKGEYDELGPSVINRSKHLTIII